MSFLNPYVKVASLFLLVSLIWSNPLQGQDRHFSQFYASPLTMNPALTGAFAGKFRIAGIYRDQWRPALERPFTTISTALDFRFKVPNVSQYADAIGVGLIFYKDEVRFGNVLIHVETMEDLGVGELSLVLPPSDGDTHFTEWDMADHD